MYSAAVYVVDDVVGTKATVELYSAAVYVADAAAGTNFSDSPFMQ